MNYATFWQRFVACLIDILILLSIILLTDEWIESVSKSMVFVIDITTSIIYTFYLIYCHGKFGQTIGKRVMDIRVIYTNGETIGWRGAWLRSSVDLMFSIIGLIAVLIAFTSINDIQFYDGDWIEQIQNLNALEPNWLNWMDEEGFQIWVLADVIVMLFSNKRQAIHDLIAGTIVVSNKLEATQLDETKLPPYAKADNAIVLIIPRSLALTVFITTMVWLSFHMPKLSEFYPLNKTSKPTESSTVNQQPVTVIEPIKTENPPILNINTASLSELNTLPMVSERVAQGIIDGRPYLSVEDLTKVYGIGPKTLEAIRPFVKLD